MFWPVMIVATILVAGGWIAYAIHEHKLNQEEKNKPKVRSERLQKTHGELSDWAKKMAEFKKPVAKRQARGGEDDQDSQATNR